MSNKDSGGVSVHRGLRFLTGDAALYGGAAAISKAAMLITFPLLARSYTVEEYGVVDFFLMFSTLAALIIVWGLDSAVGRFFWKYSDYEIRRILISQIFLLQLLSIVVFLSVLWAGSNWLGPRLLDYPDAGHLMGIALLQVPFLVLINFCRNLLKWEFRRAAFLCLTLGATAAQTCLLVLAVVVFEVTISGVLTVYAISNLLTAGLGIFMIRRWLCWPDRLIELDSVLRYALPVGVVSIMGALGPVLERSLVSVNLGLEDLGYLATAAKLGMFLMLLTTAFQTAWGPYYMSQYKDVGHKAEFDKVLRIFTFGICIAILGFAIFVIPLLRALASDRYLPAYEVAVLIAVAFGIQGVGWITEIGIHLSFKSFFLPIGKGLGLIATILVLWLFLPHWGLIASGVAVICGNIFVAVTLAMIAQRIHPMAWSFRPVLICLALTLAIILAAIWVGRAYGLLGFVSVVMSGIAGFLPLGAKLLFTQAELLHLLAIMRGRNGTVSE